MDLKKIRQL